MHFDLCTVLQIREGAHLGGGTLEIKSLCRIITRLFFLALCLRLGKGNALWSIWVTEKSACLAWGDVKMHPVDVLVQQAGRKKSGNRTHFASEPYAKGYRLVHPTRSGHRSKG